MSISELQLDEKRQRIALLYSETAFAEAAARWSHELTSHLGKLGRREGKVLNWDEPSENVAEAARSLARADGADVNLRPDSDWLPLFESLLAKMLSHGQNLHHPRYVGHQVPASIPIAALFDAVGSVTNQVMAIYEMGPWATAVERAMIERLGTVLGYAPDTFAGLITSGGSLANLTALLTARNAALPEVWQSGGSDASQLALVVQADVHYCITRAAGVLGIGTDQVVRVPVDEHRRMRTELLKETLCDLEQAGRKTVAVVAAACATPIGAFDRLHDVADVCQQHGVWLHVDAAHGGAAVMSKTHRHLVDGIARADSVVWDAHKMLFMPALCAFTLYKDRAHRFGAFQQDAPYLFDPSNPGIAEYDSGTQTLECTKRAAAFGLWGIWSLFGRTLFEDLVDVTFATTKQFYALLAAAADFHPLHQPECNIQAFRYVPDFAKDWSPEDLGAFQLELRRKLIHSGTAYIVPIKLDGVGALRGTVIHPCTTRADLADVLESIRDCGEQLRNQGSTA